MSDTAWIKPQIHGLSNRWNNLRALAKVREEKLDQAKERSQG